MAYSYVYAYHINTSMETRVESGSDDLDNLGHFFGGLSGSYLQTKLSGCDPDITCSLKNSVGIWYVSKLGSDGCTEISLV